MQAKDVMTTNVNCVEPSTSVHEAARRMKTLNVGVLPVCEKGKLVGMITDRDITLRVTAEGKDADRSCVSEVMSPEVASCSDDDPIDKVVQLMEEKKVRRIPVIDHRGNLAGIISLGDLARRAETETACEVLEYVSQP